MGHRVFERMSRQGPIARPVMIGLSGSGRGEYIGTRDPLSRSGTVAEQAAWSWLRAAIAKAAGVLAASACLFVAGDVLGRQPAPDPDCLINDREADPVRADGRVRESSRDGSAPGRRARDNDRTWNDRGAQLGFAGIPSFGQTWWFGVVAVGLLSSAAAVRWWPLAGRRGRSQADDRMRLVFEASPNSMVIVDAAGRIIMANAMTERVFGYLRREVIGQAVEMLMPERFAGSHATLRLGYATDPKIRPMGVGRELLGRRKDGSEFPIEVGLTPIHAPDGPMVLASIVDISERRHAELESLHQREELAHLSRVNMLGELSGSLIHELNQPLTAILSNAQAAQRLLERGPLDLNELREILSDIVGEDKRAADVIHRLRTLLKKSRIDPTSLDVGEVVKDVLRLLRNTLINKGVTLRTDLDPTLPRVLGDRVQLQQVLVNLVINGCEAMAEMPMSDRRLSIAAQTVGDHHVRISVSDSGTGIAPEHKDQVFRPFFTTKPTGIGLGLAVCRTIITSSGGELWAANNADRGAAFHFTLPVQKDAPQ